MALEEYLGCIVMEVDSVEVDISSLGISKKGLRKLVKTMNRTGRPKGFSKMMEEINLKVSAVIPLDNKIDWDNIQGASITVYPSENDGKRTSYKDCFTIDTDKEYKVDSESRIDIMMAALREIDE